MYLDSNPYSTRSQMIMILLGIMADRKGGHSKQEVISMIEESGWFDFKEEDRNPYPTVKTGEPRWHTSVAFRRKDCYEEDLFVRDGVRDCWTISKDGVNAFVRRKMQFASGELDCSMCYMWSLKFKKHICPNYVPSANDRVRPDDVYKDYYRDRLMQRYLNLARLLKGKEKEKTEARTAQSAARPESDPDVGDKSQPESESCSQ
jgi:hypothetical protein